MYDIALTVVSCLQAGTRADVAWLVSAEELPILDWSDAAVFTPGGGKVGSLAGGAVDAKLIDVVGRIGAARLVDVELTQTDALISGLSAPGSARCIVAPAEALPPELWDLAMAREPFCVFSELHELDVVGFDVYSEDTVAVADVAIREALSQARPGSMITESAVISVFNAVPQVVVVGSGPVAESVIKLAEFMGWRGHLVDEGSRATGLIATLGGRDMVVVAAHDLELSGLALAAALESDSGYIGSVGSRSMQGNRADWLAYRGMTDLSRVHGPAGLDIGAASAEEIAVSIVGEAIASRTRP